MGEVSITCMSNRSINIFSGVQENQSSIRVTWKIDDVMAGGSSITVSTNGKTV